MLASISPGLACARRKVSSSGSKPAPEASSVGGDKSPGGSTDAEAAAAALAHDVERLSRRVYAEEGIPVLLTLENLIPSGSASSQAQPLREGKLPRAQAKSEGTALAAELIRQAELWKRSHPNRTEEDVTKLLEVLADRDLRQQPPHRHR